MDTVIFITPTKEGDEIIQEQMVVLDTVKHCSSALSFCIYVYYVYLRINDVRFVQGIELNHKQPPVQDPLVSVEMSDF